MYEQHTGLLLDAADWSSEVKGREGQGIEFKEGLEGCMKTACLALEYEFGQLMNLGRVSRTERF